MSGPAGEDRQRPALSLLDVAAMSPIECYALVTLLVNSQDPAVTRALSDAMARVAIRTRLAGPP